MKKLLLWIMIASFITSVGTASVQAETSINSRAYFDESYLQSITDMIHERYKDDVVDQDLVDGALKGMFSVMDPYTNYMTKKEADILFGDLEGTYKGIGAMLEQVDDHVVIVKVFEGSPAEKVGILAGDMFLEVNGISMRGKNTDEVAKQVRGPEGTTVECKIFRSSTNETLQFKITRSEIKINPVSLEYIGNIAYIKLSSFNMNAYSEMKKILVEIDRKGYKNIILDLRDNPGGELQQVVNIARLFIPAGLITKLDFKAPYEKDTEYYSPLSKIKYKTVVLVNEMSASASEILAGAFQDTKSATLVGQKTYGKSRVQHILPLLTPEATQKYEKQTGFRTVDADILLRKFGIDPPDQEIQGWTKMTVGEYMTPLGRKIDGVGLMPDVKIKNFYNEKSKLLFSVAPLAKVKEYVKSDEDLQILYAKRILHSSDYPIQDMTMKLDDETIRAILKFQQDNSLRQTGILDLQTQEALNQTLTKGKRSQDKQLTKAIKLIKKMK